VAVFSVISPHFRPRRHRLIADDYRTEMADRLGWSHSKISRIYNGKRGATAEDVSLTLRWTSTSRAP